MGGTTVIHKSENLLSLDNFRGQITELPNMIKKTRWTQVNMEHN